MTEREASDSRADRYRHQNTRAHALANPGFYGVVTQPTKSSEWIWAPSAQAKLAWKDVTYAPGLLRIFIEAFNNACDECVRAHKRGEKLEPIIVDINEARVQITNAPSSMPITQQVTKQGLLRYVPEMCFGIPRSSSNFGEDADSVIGTYGIGIKMTNIMSKRFLVEIDDPETGLHYHQEWRENMQAEAPVVSESTAQVGRVVVTYYPDFARFGVKGHDQTLLGLVARYAYDASYHLQVPVIINKTVLQVPTARAYLAGYFANSLTKTLEGPLSKVNGKMTIHIIDYQPAHLLSFVNGSLTNDGGLHCQLAKKVISGPLVQALNEKLPEGARHFTGPDVTKHLTMVVIVNFYEGTKPTFPSAQKSQLTGPKFSFKLPATNLLKILKWKCLTDLGSELLALRKKVLSKSDGKKVRQLRPDVERLVQDATWAGGPRSQECTLLLCEGGSAISWLLMLMNNLPGGRMRYGVFELGGVIINPLNYENSNPEKIANSTTVTLLKEMMGIKQGADYRQHREQLRYWKVVVLTDEDSDGCHIKGLVINLFNYISSSLIELEDFINVYRTPTNRVYWSSKKWVNFYSRDDYDKWYQEVGQHQKGWRNKHFKGLGTFMESDIRETIRDPNLLVTYKYDDQTRQYLELAFGPQRSRDRKDWIIEAQGGHATHTDEKSLSGFFANEFIKFMFTALHRAVPQIIDGKKISFRQIVFAASRHPDLNKGEDVLVARLVGYVHAEVGYEHGEASLGGTIIGLTQCGFAGANLLPLFDGIGNFGNRETGGAVHGSPRYVYVKKTPWNDQIFRPEDRELFQFSHGTNIQPDTLLPIIPMNIVNGVNGIACGWRTYSPSYHPLDVIAHLRYYLEAGLGQECEPPPPLKPFFARYDGLVTQEFTNPYQTMKIEGRHYRFDGETPNTSTIIITELPVTITPAAYKLKLVSWLEKGLIQRYVYNCLGNNILIIMYGVNITTSGEVNSTSEFYDKRYKLATSLKLSNINAIDKDGRVNSFATIEDLLDSYYEARFDYFELRRLYIIQKLNRMLSEKRDTLRFFRLVVSGQLKISNRPVTEIEEDILSLGLPLKPYRKSPLPSISSTAIDKLTKEIKGFEAELTFYEQTTAAELWLRDLTELTPIIQTRFLLDDYTFYLERWRSLQAALDVAVTDLVKNHEMSLRSKRAQQQVDEQAVTDGHILEAVYPLEIERVQDHLQNLVERQRIWLATMTVEQQRQYQIALREQLKTFRESLEEQAELYANSQQPIYVNFNQLHDWLAAHY